MYLPNGYEPRDMPKSDVSFASAIESRTRGVYIELLRANPALTLGELQQLCREEFGKVLSTITLGELCAGDKAAKFTTASASKSPSHRSTKKPTKTAKATVAARTKPKSEATTPTATASAEPSGAAEVNTRTPAGRRAFDEMVFAAIKSIAGPAGAGAIQKVTGGTNMQVRSACNRLIEAGRVTWSGKARGTRYQAA